MRTCLWIVATLGLSGCASAVAGNDVPMPRGNGTGFLPDGADPFQQQDAADVSALPDAAPWVLPDVPTTSTDDRYGYVTFGRSGYTTDGSIFSYTNARFRLAYEADDPRCREGVIGPWYFSDCNESLPEPMDTHPRPYPHAGEIRFTGGRETVTLRPTVEGLYNQQSEFGEWFLPGQTIRVRAVGATVPTFEDSVVIPGDLEASLPGNPSGVVQRNMDLRLQWSATRTEFVQIYVLQNYNQAGVARSATLSAEFYGDEGTATIPAAILQRVPGSEEVSIYFTPYNRVELRAGAWPITLRAAGRGRLLRVTFR